MRGYVYNPFHSKRTGQVITRMAMGKDKNLPHCPSNNATVAKVQRLRQQELQPVAKTFSRGLSRLAEDRNGLSALRRLQRGVCDQQRIQPILPGGYRGLLC